jgi:hypothetical protein
MFEVLKRVMCRVQCGGVAVAADCSAFSSIFALLRVLVRRLCSLLALFALRQPPLSL